MSLVTIKNVELMEVGEDWPLASGPTTFTEEHLLSVVASQSDPAVKAPRLKIGHDGDLSTGQPAFGKFINLRVTANGQKLVGDLAGVPKWLADVLPTAYPNRSVEGALDFTSHTGKKWDLVLTNVSMLGVTMPGISTLEDLEPFFEDEMPEGVEVAASVAWPGTTSVEGVIANYQDGNPIKGRNMTLKASVNVEDVRRSFYDNVAVQGTPEFWWWIRTIQIDPAQVIVEDDETQTLLRIPYVIADDEVTWADPIAVEIQYVDLPEVAASQRIPATTYASAAESRPQERNQMDPKEIRLALGLPEDATDAVVTDKIKELKASEPAPDPTPDPDPVKDDETEGSKKQPVAASAKPFEVPEGMVLVDASAFESTKKGAERANELWAKQETQERDTEIMAAVKAGKFPKARIEHFAGLWDVDKEGTKAILAALQPGVIPVTELGSSTDTGLSPVGEGAEAYPDAWLTAAERANVAAAAAGTLETPRITTERVAGGEA